ncbi:MAG: hypothetical protein R3F61_28385 [Myxococcota bacterium]
MLFALAMTASGAEVTWMPDRLSGAATLRYGGRYERGYLEEQGIRISERRLTEHHVDLGVQFAPVPGAAVTVDLAMTPSWLWRYPNARQMLLEPVDGGGSYVFSPDPVDAEPVDVKGGGIEGVWLGLALAPFSEAFDLGQRVTWRFDVAYRTGNKSNNRWTFVDGKRGGGPGGSALKVQGAFSRRGGSAEPYVRGSFVKENKVTVDLTDGQGNTIATGLELQPASTAEILGGTEVISSDRDGTRTAMDFQLGFRYRTWEDVPSGLLLPNVIEASKTIPVTHSESLQGLATMGLNLVFSDIVRTTTGARFEYTVPHTQEHVYDVQTSPDTFGVGWYFSITGTLGPDDLSP